MTRMAVATPGTVTATPVVAPDHREPGQLSHRQILTILTGLLLGMFLAALDQTIVSSSIRTIADNLHGLDQQAWATTAYLITSTVSTPLYGKMSDLWGRKPLFVTAISVFVVGSLACSFSQSMYQLAAFRGLQGIGAGGLMSLAFAIIGDIVPPRERAKYQGYFMAVFGTSSVAGPVIGGFFAGQAHVLGVTGWRWVFLVNVPIGILALAVVTAVLNIPHTRRKHRIDWLGAITIAIGVVPLLIVAEQGRSWGWTSRNSVVCYVVGGIGLLLFVFAEKWMKDDALIPLRLFRNGVFTLTSAGGLFIGVAMFGGIALIPQYLQIVKGASPTKAGLLMLPLMLGIMSAAMISGQITAKTGRYKIFPILGSILMVAGMLLLSQLKWDTPLWRTDVNMVVMGLGLGLCMQTLTVAVQNAVPPRDMGVASSSSMFFRQMGGTLGTAVFLSLLFGTVGGKITSAFRNIVPTPAFQAALSDPTVQSNPANQPVLTMLQGGGGGTAGGVLQDSSFIQHLDARLALPFQVGFSDSMDLVFLTAIAAPVIALLLLVFMKEIPLRTQSGMAAMAAEEAGVVAVPVAAAAPVAANGHRTATNGHRPAPNGRHALDAARNSPAHISTPHTETGAALMSDAVTAPGGGSQIRGKVIRADGTPISNAALTLIDLHGQQVARTATDDTGRYGVPALAMGTYVLIASAGTHQPHASTVTVNNGAVDVDLVLTGSTRLYGTVSVGDSGLPVASAAVTVTDVRGEVIAARVTGVDGGYSLDGLSAGDYTLVVSAENYRPVAAGITLPQSGEQRQDLKLLGGARLSGTARAGQDGHPVREARITLVDAAGNVAATTITSTDGTYRLDDLAAGDYTVIASGYPPAASSLRVAAGAQSEHDVELGYPDA